MINKKSTSDCCYDKFIFRLMQCQNAPSTYIDFTIHALTIYTHLYSVLRASCEFYILHVIICICCYARPTYKLLC